MERTMGGSRTDVMVLEVARSNAILLISKFNVAFFASLVLKNSAISF